MFQLHSEKIVAAVAQALFDRACIRAEARGHKPHHPSGTLVRSMPNSYREDYEEDARAMIRAFVVAQAIPFELIDLEAHVAKLCNIADGFNPDFRGELWDTIQALRQEMNQVADGRVSIDKGNVYIPDASLFDRLHIEPLVREWCAGTGDQPHMHPQLVSGLLNVLRLRLSREDARCTVVPRTAYTAAFDLVRAVEGALEHELKAEVRERLALEAAGRNPHAWISDASAHPLVEIAPGPWRLEENDGERMAVVDADDHAFVKIDTRNFDDREDALEIARWVVRSGPGGNDALAQGAAS